MSLPAVSVLNLRFLFLSLPGFSVAYAQHKITFKLQPIKPREGAWKSLERVTGIYPRTYATLTCNVL